MALPGTISGVEIGASSGIMLRASGQVSNATLLTLTTTTTATLIPDPGAGLLIRPLRVQLILQNGAASTGLAFANSAHLQLQQGSSMVLASGADTAATPAVNAMTTPSIHTSAWSTAAAAATGQNPLPDAFWTSGLANTSNTAEFLVNSMCFNGTGAVGVGFKLEGPIAGQHLPLTLASTTVAANVSNASGSAVTLYYNISYEIVPVFST